MASLKDFLLTSQAGEQDAPDHMRRAGRPLRVVLLQPPRTGGVACLEPQNEDGTEGIGHKPPLGLLYLATTLTHHSPHQVTIIDAQVENLSFAETTRRIAELAPDVVGISAWTDFWYPAHECGRRIKAELPGIHLCYGGPHLGIYPEETLAIPFIDSVIAGDGEMPFLHLCNMVSNGRLDGQFPGLHLKSSGVADGVGRIFVQGDLDALPIPDRTLLSLERYTSVLSKGRFVTTMITSRGCPHRCTFCKLTFQKNLARSADSILEEFRQIHRLGIREVEIYDDTFTWGRDRLKQICEGLIALNLGIEWAVRDRVSKADPDMLALMYRAGCRRIHYGVESGSEHVLRRMKKQITTQEARIAVSLAKSARLQVLTYFMFGNLDESEADMRQTVDFAISLDADYATFSITIPYAGTEMYDEALAQGIIATDYWRDYATHPTAEFRPPQLIENNVTLDRMLAIRKEGFRRFYFRPKYLLRQIRRVSTLPELLRKARMGVRLAQSVYTR